MIMNISPETFNLAFKKIHGRNPSGGRDRGIVLNHWAYSAKRDDLGKSRNDIITGEIIEYEENMVHCKACEAVGREPIHLRSLINIWNKPYGNREGECTLGFGVFRNGLRTSEELSDSASGRYKESVVTIFRKERGETILTELELRKQCLEIHGEICFKCDSHDNITIDHILSLHKFWPASLKNSIPLCKGCNSKKRALLPSEFYTHEELVRLAERSEYTLEELQTATYNFDFVDWFNVPENKDRVYEYIMSNREKSTQYWNSVSKTIDDANIELKRINGSHLVL